jgi:hypothetical protein
VLPPLALDETRPLHPRSVRLELIHPRVGLGCVSRANQQAPSDLVLPFRVVVPLRAPAASRPRPAPGHRPRPAPSSCGRPCPVRCASSSDPAWGAREYDSAPPTAGSNWKCRSPSRWRLASSDGRGGGDERDRPRGSSDGCRDSDAEERPFPAPPSPSPSRPPPPSATRPGSRIRGRRCVRVVVACRSGGCRRRSRSHRRRRRRRSHFCYRRPLEIGWRSTREGGLRPGPQEGHEIEQVNQRPQPALGPYSPFGDGDEGALSS